MRYARSLFFRSLNFSFFKAFVRNLGCNSEVQNGFSVAVWGGSAASLYGGPTVSQIEKRLFMAGVSAAAVFCTSSPPITSEPIVRLTETYPPSGEALVPSSLSSASSPVAGWTMSMSTGRRFTVFSSGASLRPLPASPLALNFAWPVPLASVPIQNHLPFSSSFFRVLSSEGSSDRWLGSCSSP